MNISSIVVQVLPENYDEVKETLEASGKCEYHFGEKEKGKMKLMFGVDNDAQLWP